MTTLDAVNAKEEARPTAEAAAAAELGRMAKEKGWSLIGSDGLLNQLTKTVLETGLNEGMAEHLGYEKARPGRAGVRERPQRHPPQDRPDQIDRARGHGGAAGPGQHVRAADREKAAAPAGRVDEIVLSLHAKGLTNGEISAHFQEIYGAAVARETISRVTDKVSQRCKPGRPARWIRAVYAAVFIDALVVKIRDGQVANRPIYAAIGVSLDGEKDILGLWAGTGGEGAKFWMSVLTDIRNRGVKDVFFLDCDGLKRRPRSRHPTGSYGRAASLPFGFCWCGPG